MEIKVTRDGFRNFFEGMKSIFLPVFQLKVEKPIIRPYVTTDRERLENDYKLSLREIRKGVLEFERSSRTKSN